MKKSLILVAVAAVALSACSKNEIIPTIEESAPAISFGTYGPRSITKADADNYVSGTQLIADADFDVWGWYTANGVSFTGGNGTQFFGSTHPWYTVTYKAGGGSGSDGTANTYEDGPRYWPTGETPNYLHFYAYYPSDKGTITPPANGLGAFSFTAEGTAASQVDFMVADVVKDQVYGATNATVGETNKGTVDLTFRHMLTKVQVKFKTTQAIVDDTNTDIKVQSASFVNINNTGTLTSSYDGTTFGTAWSAVSGAATYSIPVDASTALTATATNYGDDETGIFLLVPQTMLANDQANAQYITVTWDVITDGVTTTNTRKIYLDDCVTTDQGSTPANIDWAKNNFVTYVITIAPNQILFTGAAENWDAEKTGYYNIN